MQLINVKETYFRNDSNRVSISPVFHCLLIISIEQLLIQCLFVSVQLSNVTV